METRKRGPESVGDILRRMVREGWFKGWNLEGRPEELVAEDVTASALTGRRSPELIGARG